MRKVLLALVVVITALASLLGVTRVGSAGPAVAQGWCVGVGIPVTGGYAYVCYPPNTSTG